LTHTSVSRNEKIKQDEASRSAAFAEATDAAAAEKAAVAASMGAPATP